jgi:hypothetical protein
MEGQYKNSFSKIEVVWILLAQDMYQWRVRVNMTTKIGFS